MAKKILFPKDELPPLLMDEIEHLILQVAQEFFDNSETGDKSKGYMKMALNTYVFLELKIVLRPKPLQIVLVSASF